MYSLGILTGSGGSIKYTYYRAQGKTDKANAYFTLSLLLTSAIAVVCWIGLTVFDDQLLRLFGAKLLWWVMPITEFTVAIYTVLCISIRLP